MKKVALITGITGQDGSYLAELLINKKYEVHGIIRRSSSFNTNRIEHLYKDVHDKDRKLFLHYGDMLDYSSLINIINEIKPDEIYNLAAQSHVKVSFEMPVYTTQVNCIGVLNILEAIKNIDKNIRFYQASTSEMYGNHCGAVQFSTTKFDPVSPYAIAKLHAFYTVKMYREAYNIFACNGILFNHESPRRGETFLTKKVVKTAVDIVKRKKDVCLYVGNINAKRDWGYAPEYVEAMWLMLQQDKPDDYVIATGISASVKDFITYTFKYLNVELIWDVDNQGLPMAKWGDKIVVKTDLRYFRPIDVKNLCGYNNIAYQKLGWSPKVTFSKLIEIMVNEEIKNG